jgi:alpha-amylase
MHDEKQWLLQSNVYEVNLRQYTEEGTIKAFEEHLPRLKDMGVEILWFMPITPIAQLNKKGSLGSYYACADYTSVDSEFGTLEDFKGLVSHAHEMGFKVIIDWVANHTGWDHVWTKEHHDYYKKDEANDFVPASSMDDIIELDFDNPDLRTTMIDAMKFWLDETGIDGFRCDLAFWVELDFWIEAKNELEKIRPLFWLGELDPVDNPEYMQVFDAGYTWAWMHTTKTFYDTRTGIQPLLDVLNRYNNTPGIKAWFTSNHDENSWNGTEYDKYEKAALMLAVFSCTWPGIPLIYSGQELPNKKRLEFFDKDIIEWTGEYALHSFYKTLLELRRKHPALAATGAFHSFLATSKEKEIIAYSLEKVGDSLIVFLNFSAGEVEVNFSAAKLEGVYRDVFTGEKIDFSIVKFFSLDPWGYKLFEPGFGGI